MIKETLSIVSSLWLKGSDVDSYAYNKEETFVVEWRDLKKPVFEDELVSLQ